MTSTRGPLKLKPAEFGSDKDIGIVKVENNGNLSLLAEVYEIVNSSGRKADVKANARMFAAAPEMFAALEGILDINNPPWGEPGHVDFTTAIKMGRKALAQVGE